MIYMTHISLSLLNEMMVALGQESSKVKEHFLIKGYINEAVISGK